MIFNDDFYDVK